MAVVALQRKMPVLLAMFWLLAGSIFILFLLLFGWKAIEIQSLLAIRFASYGADLPVFCVIVQRFLGVNELSSLALLSLVLLLPVTRLMSTLYVVTPIVLGRAPLPGAKRVFRFAEALKPWSMAEIFALGGGIALIKIVDLAHVSLGPAVWMFGGFVVLMAVQNTLVCRWSLWSALDR